MPRSIEAQVQSQRHPISFAVVVRALVTNSLTASFRRGLTRGRDLFNIVSKSTKRTAPTR